MILYLCCNASDVMLGRTVSSLKSKMSGMMSCHGSAKHPCLERYSPDLSSQFVLCVSVCGSLDLAMIKIFQLTVFEKFERKNVCWIASLYLLCATPNTHLKINIVYIIMVYLCAIAFTNCLIKYLLILRKTKIVEPFGYSRDSYMLQTRLFLLLSCEYSSAWRMLFTGNQFH